MKLVFDIGATHMRIAEAHGEEIGEAKRVRTPVAPDEAVETFVALAQSFNEPLEALAGGVAAIVADGAILTATNLPAWNGFHFADALHARLSAPVTLINDAEVDGLGEALYGAGKGFHSLAYLGIGTGVGTSHIRDGAVEPHSSDGDARASIIALSDGTSLEERVGGRSLERTYGVPARLLSREVWNELTGYLAESVGNALRLWQPDILVLAGSGMNEETGFRIDDVVALLPEGHPPVVRGALGDACGLYGALTLLA